MKKTFSILLSLLIIVSTSAQVFLSSKKRKEQKKHFSVKNDVVYFDSKPFAKYQAKTYSLDGGELVEEYNLLLIDYNLSNKQLIGDLIDYISDRHQNAEVEVEIDSKNSLYPL